MNAHLIVERQRGGLFRQTIDGGVGVSAGASRVGSLLGLIHILQVVHQECEQCSLKQLTVGHQLLQRFTAAFGITTHNLNATQPKEQNHVQSISFKLAANTACITTLPGAWQVALAYPICIS